MNSKLTITALVSMILFTQLFCGEIKPNDRHKIDYETSWTKDASKTHTVSASAIDCSFETTKTEAPGSATLSVNLSDRAAAEKSITHTDIPNTSSFGFLVKGILAGSGNGSVKDWSVTLQQKFFWLEPVEKIYAEGTSITVNARGSIPSPIEWSVAFPSWTKSRTNTSGSITLNKTFWETYKIPIPTGRTPPLAGVYNVSAISTNETPNRSADPASLLYVVSITKPAADGIPEKWEPGTARYDNQAVRSSSPGSYNLLVNLNRAGRTDHKVKTTGGGQITTANNLSFTYVPGDTAGTHDITLSFGSGEVIDRRSVVIFEDNLARDYYNFGISRTCWDGWKPIARYGVDEENIDGMGNWNCHGSVLHVYDNSGPASSTHTVAWPASLTKYDPDYSFWGTMTLKRGDVVAFYYRNSDGTLDLCHSHTCINPQGKLMWGANNKGGWSNHWLWFACSSQNYYDDTKPFVNYVALLPKP